MKHAVYLAAAAAGFAFATAPALAGDIAQVIQTGISNNAAIEQLASNGNNSVRIRQDKGWADAIESTAQVVQSAVSNSVVDVFQQGFRAQAHVFQHDGSDLQVLINAEPERTYGLAEGNILTVDQSGHGARAQVEQGGILDRADIVQHGLGGNSFAGIAQSGDFHEATIFQVGHGATATIIQTGEFNSGGVQNGHRASIRQSY